MRVLGMGYTPDPPAPITVASVWSGGVTDTSAVIVARSTDADAVVLRLSTDSGLAGAHPFSMTEGNNDQWRRTLTGLDPDTRYYVGFAGSAVVATFRTFPEVGTPYSFGIAAASCAGHSGGEYVTSNVSNAPTFDRIRERMESGDILGFMHLGDRHYRDISTNNLTSFRNAYNDVMAAAKQNAMHLQGWVDYVWDDHDFGPNDSHAGSASKPAAQATYREHVPHWPLPVSDSIQHTYVIGRVRFIHLDVRSYRSTNGSTDNSSKTALGATQKEWLLDTTNEATEPLIVVNTVMPWNGSGSISFGSFSTERDELIAAWTAQAKKDRLAIIHGDNHFMAGDDGTNAPGGIPTFNLAAADAGYTSNDGTWLTGILKHEQQQYGALYIVDDEESVDLTVKGWSVANPSGTETERMNVGPLAY